MTNLNKLEFCNLSPRKVNILREYPINNEEKID